MRKRKGFQHWMGSKLPKRLSEEQMLKCYKVLRYGRSEKAKAIARKLIIMNHLGLGFAHATRFVNGRPEKADELVGEMIYGLVQGVNLIEQGAVDNHEGTPNISGYLVTSMRGYMLRHIRHRQPEILPHPDHPKRGNLIEIQELIDKATKSDREKRIIQLRIAGHNDPEIAEIIGITVSAIQQARTRVAQRLKELMV